ncbi:DNA-binding response regulator [Luteitalea sp. TBR-22]|uniref:response regulator transcription factor n=1 Tax=Luteitalea sp. TBR-22 TaxID=2802971 RepID=UPI001AF6710F|nr:response regulator transcription factor [Luteitalea sp. TBR-22]BCS32442.1 DNA-binding response regulator [Luteitalea sp. TBR-22]
MSTIRVVLVDDHETVRQGLALLLNGFPDVEVVGEAGDGRAGVGCAREQQPDVVVMDVAMPGTNGLEATRELKEGNPGIGVVALSRYGDDAYVQELLRAGASGYVLKQSAPGELLNAIRAAAAGQHYLDKTLSARVTGAYVRKHARTAGPEPPSITEREAEVLRQMAWGYSNKDIAARLDLSVKTVEVHKANAMRKLGLRGRIDIVRYALLQGWLREA